MSTQSFSRRKFLQTGAAALLGTSLFMSAGTKLFAAPTKTPFGQIRFGVIADPHLDIRGKNGMKMSQDSLSCVQETVQDLNQEKDLAFVLVAGDLLLDGEWENAEALKKELDTLSMPYFVVAGNHDFVPQDPAKRREGFSYMTIEEFVTYFQGHGYDQSGKRYYAREIVPGLRLIGLDACLPMEKNKWGGVLPQEQLTWLDQELSEHSDALNLIVMHHNFIRWTADELPGGPKQWFCIDNDQEARAVLSKHAPAAPVVLSGHRHIGLNQKEINGVNYFIMPSINSHPMRYTLFTISNKHVSWRTPMVDVSESKHLEAKSNLLQATWWRASQFQEDSTFNNAKVLGLYENNDMTLGSIPL